MILKSVKTIILILLVITCTASELNKVPLVIDSIASFYHQKFEGRKTASGETFKQGKLTAANNTLPLGTQVKVTRIIEEETLSVQVKINDRTHPKFAHRIDLSKSAAKKLKITGIAPVKIEVL